MIVRAVTILCVVAIGCHSSGPSYRAGVEHVYGYSAKEVKTALGAESLDVFAVRRNSSGTALKVYTSQSRTSGRGKLFVVGMQGPTLVVDLPDLTVGTSDDGKVVMWRDRGVLRFATSAEKVACASVGSTDSGARFFVVDCGSGQELRATADPGHVIYKPSVRVQFLEASGDSVAACGPDEQGKTLRCELFSVRDGALSSPVRSMQLGVSSREFGVLDVDVQSSRVLVSERADDDGHHVWWICEADGRRRELGPGTDFGFFLKADVLSSRSARAE